MKKIIKIFICFLLIFSMQLPCLATTVSYTKKGTYVYEKASCSSNKKWLKKNTKVYIIGSEGKFYIIYNTKKTTRGYILKKNVITITEEKETGLEWKEQVVLMHWNSINKSIFKRNSYAYLYLIKTGQVIKIKRMGGKSHADIEPATKTDTAKLYNMAGKKWSWTTYPVILYASNLYIAGSINAYPHGNQTIKTNNFPGQICLHFIGSKTHETDMINLNHQQSIQDAYLWARGN